MNTGKIITKLHKLSESLFFSNYFYGICAVSLSIEACLQQRIPINSFLYFAMVFFITVLYYSYPYIRKTLVRTDNPRTNWYARYYTMMRWNQIIITIILAVLFFLFCEQFGNVLWNTPAADWSLIFVFPVVEPELDWLH